MKRPRTIVLGCLAACSVVASIHAQLRTRVQAAEFINPTAFVPDPTDRDLQFVVQQDGRIVAVRGGIARAADMLDLRADVVSGGEQGLLGLAFPPDAATSRRFYVNFTDRAGNTVVARFRRSSDPAVADRSSRFDLRWGGAGGAASVGQPFANHNGGHLAFGPDGYLYIGLGDGGSANYPCNRAQTPLELLCNMTRVVVDVTD